MVKNFKKLPPRLRELYDESIKWRLDKPIQHPDSRFNKEETLEIISWLLSSKIDISYELSQYVLDVYYGKATE